MKLVQRSHTWYRFVSVCLVGLLVAAFLPAPDAIATQTAGAQAKSSKAVLKLFSKPGELHAPSGIRPLGADDTIAGAVPLPVSPVGGTLDFATDSTDVYSVTLAAGTRFTVVLTGDASLSCDAYLYDPFVTDADATAAAAGTLGDAFPKKLSFDVASGEGGEYHLAIDAVAGSGSYTLAWSASAVPSELDDDIPGIIAPASPVNGSLTEISDVDDVFRMTLAEGQRIQATLSGPAGADFDLYLYAPGVGSVSAVLPIGGSAGPGSSEYFVYDVSAGGAGVFYLDVHCARGSGPYSLVWSISDVPAGTWETASAASPLATGSGTVDGGLNRLTDANDYFSIVLAAGDRLSITLTGGAGTDFDFYTYGQGGSNPLAWANDAAYPERVVLDAAVAGTYYIEVVSFSGSGQYTMDYATSRTPVWSDTVRLAGTDRFKTVVALSAATFAAGSCETVVMAMGENFPDALAASGLAGVYRSPILLTRKTSVPAEVLGELSRLGAHNVVIVGGAAAVGPEVEAALQHAGIQPTRIQGANRYSTAAAVAAEVARLKGPDFAKVAFVTRGDVFADALALAPFAYSQGYPVLLTRTDSLVPECSGAISSLAISEVYVAGSNRAVSDGVKGSLNDLPTVISPVERLGGSDRYATAAAIAEKGLKLWWGDAAHVGIATGLNFPDALGGGAVCGSLHGVLLLTSPTSLSAPTAAFLSAHGSEVVDTEVYGGSSVLSDVVKSQIDQLIK
ncbi:MAG: cell wall-binding repeat-containing protein [Actinomycetia bacterium]|nr:cell wall-binding repeat-containing protein [Actinomycetes bacterium]